MNEMNKVVKNNLFGNRNDNIKKIIKYDLSRSNFYKRRM